MYWCGYFVASNGPNWEYFSIISIFGVVFGQNFGIWPPGCTFIGFFPTVMELILKVQHQGLSKMYCCGYFVLSNSTSWEYFSIISIFGVIFGQNLGIWPPGVPIYWVLPNCYGIDIEDIASMFILNVVCGYY